MVMKKHMKTCLCVFIIILFISLALATEIRADTSDEIGAELEQTIPEHLRDYYLRDGEKMTAPSFSDVLGYLSKSIADRITSPLRTLSSLMVIAVISAVFHLCSEFINNEQMRCAFECACAVSMTLSVLSSCNFILNDTRIFLGRLAEFSLSLAPILTGICIATGNIGSAAVTGTGISVFVAVCEELFSTVLFSMVTTSLAFSVCSCMNDDKPDLSSLSLLVRRAFSVIMGFIMMLYCAVMAYQSIISSSADSLSVRTVTFAIGNTVPVVGASLGAAVRTVSGALSSLKGTVGGVGISVILLLVLPCTISLLLERMAVSAAAAFCGMFGLKREAKLLEGVITVYGYAVALSVSASIMLIFMLSVVSSVSVNIGGV